MFPQPTIETQRLRLRPFELSDAPIVQHLAGHRAIADTTQRIPHPYQDGMAEEWIASNAPGFESGKKASFAVVLKHSSELVGSVGLDIDVNHKRAELGYWIGKPQWGNGYCTEAAQEVIRFGFNTLNLNRILAHHLTRNPASGRVMQKLGLTHEAKLRQHVIKWGVPEDVEVYAILRCEWLQKPDCL